jgi:hypothetical protein
MSRRTDEVLFAHRSYSTLLLLFSLTHTHARTSDRPRRRRSGRLNESKRGSFEEISLRISKTFFSPYFFLNFLCVFFRKKSTATSMRKFTYLSRAAPRQLFHRAIGKLSKESFASMVRRARFPNKSRQALVVLV